MGDRDDQFGGHASRGDVVDMAAWRELPGHLSDGVQLKLHEVRGSRTMFAVVTAAAFAPFVRSLLAGTVDPAGRWVRRRLRSFNCLWIGCGEKRVVVNAGSPIPSDDALHQLAALDLDDLPAPCVLVWRNDVEAWQANIMTPELTHRIVRPPAPGPDAHRS